MKVRTVVRVTHLWVGLLLSLGLLVLALSGSALVYKEGWWRMVHPELRTPVQDPSPDLQAAAIRAALARFPGDVRSVKMPEPGVGAFHLYLTDGEAFLDVDRLDVVDQWTPNQRVMGWLFDLHAHLLAGERGERVGGVFALLGAFLVVSGLVLWWPARRRTGLRSLVPARFDRRGLVALHRDLGLFTAPLVLVLLLSGAGIVFYQSAGVVLNGLFGDPALAADPTPGEVAFPARSAADASVLSLAAGEFDDARVVFYYPPTVEAPLHRFRVKRPCELHPNGRSWVFVDGRPRVLDAVDACGLPTGQRVLHALYPIHSANTPSGLYALLTFVAGLALAGLCASGALAYAKKLAKGSPRRRHGGSGARSV